MAAFTGPPDDDVAVHDRARERSQLMVSSSVQCASRQVDRSEYEAQCGENTVFLTLSSGLVGARGSVWNTSSAAPPMWPLSRAATRSASSTRPPERR